MKSKLGVSSALLAAGVYLTGASGWYLGLFLLVGCILLCEEEPWLRKAAFNGAALYMCFVGAGLLVDLLPGALNVISSLLATANVFFQPAEVTRVFSFLQTLLQFGRTCTMLILAFLALKKSRAATVPFGEKSAAKKEA